MLGSRSIEATFRGNHKTSVHPSYIGYYIHGTIVGGAFSKSSLFHCTALNHPSLHFCFPHSTRYVFPRLSPPVTEMHCTALEPSIPYFNTLHRTAPYCITLHRTALYCITLHRTAPYCITLRRTAPHCITLHRTALYCITLHRTALHCTALHWPELHRTALEYWS